MNIKEFTNNHRNDILIFINSFVLLIVGIYVGPINFLLFHTTVELFGVIIAIMILVIALNAYKNEYNKFLIVLGIPYGFVAVFDFLHTLTYKGIGIFGIESANLSTQLWVSARFMESVAILLASSYIYSNKRISHKKLIVYSGALFTVLLSSIYLLDIFPKCYIEGMGLTDFKKLSEYIISLLLIISTILLIKGNKKLDKKVFYLILFSYIATIASEFFFTIYTSVYALSNIIGHILKMISFYLIYKAIIETNLKKPYNILMKTIERLELEIDEKIEAQKELNREKEILHKVIDEIKESEDRYRRLFETIQDGVFVHSCNKIIYANENCASIFGVKDIKDIINRDVMDFIHEDYKKTINERTENILKQNKVSKFFEYKITDIAGNIKYVDVTSSIYNNGKEKMILTIMRDITEKKEKRELEQEVKKKSQLLNEAKKYDKVKTKFFSNISHELKTPLNIILGGIQLLTQVQSNMDKTNMKYINIMRQNCYRLLRLINNLIDITRLDSGFLKLELKNGDIIRTIENIVLSVSEYAKSKGISLIFDTNEEEKIMALDAEKLERVMLNLLSNAVKFTESGGNILVDINCEGDSIAISVKDTGIGIPREMLTKIFERFKQVDSANRRRAEGSGIGLSLVNSIIKLHGGKISIESELGKGSEFIIELPVTVMDNDEMTKDEVAATTQTNVERIQIEFSDIYS